MMTDIVYIDIVFKLYQELTVVPLDINSFSLAKRPINYTTHQYIFRLSFPPKIIKTLLTLRTPLPQTSSLHPLQPLTNTSLNNLPLLTILRIFKVTLVTKVHEVAGLVDLTLETTEGGFDGFSFSDLDFDSGLAVESGG